MKNMVKLGIYLWLCWIFLLEVFELLFKLVLDNDKVFYFKSCFFLNENGCKL